MLNIKRDTRARPLVSPLVSPLYPSSPGSGDFLKRHWLKIMSENLTETEAPAQPAVTFSFDYASAITYASYQNSVPVLRSVVVTNNTETPLTDLVLELTASPQFIQPKQWTISSISPGSSHILGDRDVKINFDYLLSLTEAEKGELRFELKQAGELVNSVDYPVRLLAREEWGGVSAMADLLAAFVMPNDPAVATIMKQASAVLTKSSQSGALNGYQSEDPKRAFLLGAAVWSACCSLGLTYAEPPKSFEDTGQKVRTPSKVLAQRLATCLDTTLLFASTLEQIGLNPVVILLNGHSFTGFWIVKTTFRSMLIEDITEVRKAIAANELVLFETTKCTSSETFQQAIESALAQLSEENEDDFILALDIARARMAQITPLSSHQQVDEKKADSGSEEFLPLPSLPDLPFSTVTEVEERPNSPASRIDRWQRKLLDLTLRNRLLNFKPTAQAIQFICEDVSLLEDKLADGKELKVISLPDHNPIGDRDKKLHLSKTGVDLDKVFVEQALSKNEVCSPATTDVLNKKLTEIYRKANNDLTEGGSNTLYLAIGFLRWKKDTKDEQVYKAPLILQPVKLKRKSVLSGFRLTNHEDEPRFNATLIQFLKQDYGVDLSVYESSLPQDASGVDVPGVFVHVRHVVRDVPGFEVVHELALSTFSFAKYLMWKDLVDRSEMLKRNRVVKHLIDNPDEPFTPGTTQPFPEEKLIDIKYNPARLFSLLPADSSQLAAALAASEGHDFIVVGPPGTGKSQTIANMIAQCLATKKTVLFVAEKTAALDVVYRRLRERGLGEFCLELHSNKAGRHHLIQQLKSAWESPAKFEASDWIKINDMLKLKRDQLNRYVAELHKRQPNGWSIFKAIAIEVDGKERYAPTLDWDTSTKHDDNTLDKIRELVKELANTWDQIKDHQQVLSYINQTDWSSAWENKLLAQGAELNAVAHEFGKLLLKLRPIFGLPPKSDCSLLEITTLCRSAEVVLATRGCNYSVAFADKFGELKSSVSVLQAKISAFQDAAGKLTAKYPLDDLNNIPLDSLDMQWREAEVAYWPLSYFKKRRTRKLLQTYALEGDVDVVNDVRHLKQMVALNDEIGHSPLAESIPMWSGYATDVSAVEVHFNHAEKLRSVVSSLKQAADDVSSVSEAMLKLATEPDNEEAVRASCAEFLDGARALKKALESYKESAGTPPASPDSRQLLADCISTTEKIKEARIQLKLWTAWCNIRNKAHKWRLVPIVSAFENDLIISTDAVFVFNLAYARWWLPTAIDESETLRQFHRHNHERTLEEFKDLDDAARQLASLEVLKSIQPSVPKPHEVAKKSELGLLRYQMNLKKPSKSIREIIAGMPEYFTKLAPCMLMSPLSIAQYLPADQKLFDVVIFDEASQITTWDAVGAIARGKQSIIVGDPKQLPPTNFFTKADGEDSHEAFEKDLESILDEATAAGLPVKRLTWHYRSKHESLIAFSNWHYYDNKLITFPAPLTSDNAVSLTVLSDGVYDRGKSRTNIAEARAIVAEATSLMRSWLDREPAHRPSLGMITFNSEQQSLIQNLLDEVLQAQPDLEWFFSEERIEPVSVKNLENVQGDERDIMLFSLTYGPDHSGKLTMSFGPINRDGGERRLNVAVTRAREHLRVFSSITADMIDTTRSAATGVAHLKTFLDYAQRGAVALRTADQGSVGEYESPFEKAVAESLEALGWSVIPQIGVSDFRIDLGIVHPKKPGAFLAGIECDGFTYHRSATARDRDKVREQVLTGLGWKILRVWSPEWWHDKGGAAKRLNNMLHELLHIESTEQVN